MRKRNPLVLVTPDRRVADDFIRREYPGVRVDDVVLISNKHDLYRVKGLELDYKRVFFLHRSWEIESAREEIMARVRNNPAQESQTTNDKGMKGGE